MTDDKQSGGVNAQTDGNLTVGNNLVGRDVIENTTNVTHMENSRTAAIAIVGIIVVAVAAILVMALVRSSDGLIPALSVSPTLVSPTPTMPRATPTAPEPTKAMQPTVSATATAAGLESDSPTPPVFPFDNTLESDIPKFTLSLTKVEFQDTGRMRWYVDFWNQTPKDYALALHLNQTYLVDENGQRYGVVAISTGTPIGYYAETVQKGVKVTRWFEFDGPRNGAKSFKFILVGIGHSDTPDFQPLQVKLDYSSGIVPSATLAAASPGLPVFPFDNTLESDIPKFTLTLTKVEFQDTGRMRWYVDFWNQTPKDYALALHLDQTYLVDENGQRYEVVAISTGTPIGYYQETVQMGVKVTRWFEFDGPRDGAKSFKLTLVGIGHSDTPDFQPLQVKLDH